MVKNWQLPTQVAVNIFDFAPSSGLAVVLADGHESFFMRAATVDFLLALATGICGATALICAPAVHHSSSACLRCRLHCPAKLHRVCDATCWHFFAHPRTPGGAHARGSTATAGQEVYKGCGARLGAQVPCARMLVHAQCSVVESHGGACSPSPLARVSFSARDPRSLQCSFTGQLGQKTDSLAHRA